MHRLKIRRIMGYLLSHALTDPDFNARGQYAMPPRFSISGMRLKMIIILVALLLGSVATTQDAYADLFVFPDTTGVTGLNTDIEINGAGNPVIAYQFYDGGADGDIMFVACTTPDCATFNTPVVIEDHPTNLLGSSLDMAITPAGNPVITYYDFNNSDLRFIACTAVDCSTTTPSIILDSFGVTGQSMFMTINSTGFPIISYWDFQEGGLGVIICTAVDCSTTNPQLVFDVGTPISQHGVYSSIEIIGGNPVISYQNGDTGDLRFLSCTAPDCSTFNAPITLVSTDIVGLYGEIGINGNGFPVIAHINDTTDRLNFIACTAVDCSTTNAPIVLDATTNTRMYLDMTINSLGNPLIVYWNFGDLALNAIRCTAPDCSTADAPVVILDNFVAVGQTPSVIINSLGQPVISYEFGGDAVPVNDLAVFTERAPRVTNTLPLDNATNVAVNSNIDIVFDENVTVTGASFTLDCTLSGAGVPFVLSGSGATYTLNPVADLAISEICTVTVIATNTTEAMTLSIATDQLDGNADGIGGDNYVFDFATASSLTRIEFNGATSSPLESDPSGDFVLLIVPAGSVSGIITVDITFGGTATGGAVDYDGVGGVAQATFDCTIPCDSTNSPYLADSISIFQDTLIEGDETVTMTLSNPSGGVILGTQINHTATIIDDDTAIIDFVLATDTIAETAGNHIAQARLSTTINGGSIGGGTLAIPISADITRADVTTAGADFSGATTATITFPATSADGATQPVTTPIFDDVLAEGNEDFTLTLSNLTSTGINVGMSLGANTAQTVTILDDDVPNVIITGAPITAEGGITDTFTVELTTDPVTDVTITLTVTDSQTLIGLVGGPYGTNLILTFTSANYDTPQTVEVVAVDDAIVEGAHVGVVNASVTSAPANYLALNPLPSVNVVISDNDTTPTTPPTTPPTTGTGTTGGSNLDLLATARALPSTGETPAWRTPVLIGIGLIVMFAVGWVMRR